MIQRFNFLFNEAGDAGGGGGSADSGAAAGAAGAGASAGSTTLLGGGDPPAGSPPAGSPSGSPPSSAAKGAWGGLVQEDGTFSEAWWEKDPDLKEHGAHLSKFKGVKDALVSGINLQGLLGKKADAVLIPGPDSPPDVIAKFREKLGVPENPEGYGLKKPDNLPEGVTWDEARVKDFSKLAHDLSLTPQQVAKLQEWDMTQAVGSSARTQEAIIATEKAELQKQETKLSEAWGNGADFTKNKELATRAAVTAGFTVEQLGSDPIFRNADVVKAFAKLGSLMSEDTLAKGATNAGYNDGYSKSMDIINNPQNPFYSRYHNGDEAVRGMVQQGLRAKK